MVKGRTTKDASSDKSCNEITRWKNIEEKRDETKSANYGAVLELWKKVYNSNHQKLDLENQDEQRLLMVSQRQGRQHQIWLRSDPTQGDAVPNRHGRLGHRSGSGASGFWMESYRIRSGYFILRIEFGVLRFGFGYNPNCVTNNKKIYVSLI